MQKKEGIDQIAIFTSKEGSISVNAKLSEDTLWLSLNQLVELFGRDKSVISRHLKKIFNENELDERAVVAKYATTAADGKKYQVDYYNLDVIISVGYRVNSKRGIEFRRWANEILKDYLIKGYSINSQKITAEKVSELQQAIELLSNTLINQKLVDSEGEEILSVIKNYSKTWDILIKYDEDRLGIPNSRQSDIEELSYDSAILAIKSIKQDLHSKGESTALFGNEKDNSLKGILVNIYQTFDGNDLYPSLEEKASHLIYFLIKNHPFSDGNKRIGCFLFLLFLQKNKKFLLNIPSPEALTAIALLIAESDPKQKDLIIKLVMNLIESGGFIAP
jgi:DNA ligase (NAD+)